MADFSAKVHGLLGGTLPWSYGFWLTGSVAEGTLADTFNTATGALFTTATNGLENFMSAAVTVDGTSVSTLNATMHQTTISRRSLSITGTNVSQSLPWDAAEVVTLRSNLATKFGHGRIFLPPFTVSQLAANELDTAVVASMVTVFNAFFTSVTGAGVSFFIFNKKTLKNGQAPYTKQLLTTFDIPNKVARQRRRVSKEIPARSSGSI